MKKFCFVALAFAAICAKAANSSSTVNAEYPAWPVGNVCLGTTFPKEQLSYPMGTFPMGKTLYMGLTYPTGH